MKNKIKVSVVIPIYNVEKYLDKCVQSVLNQTLKEIEVILVDDGSRDNCPQMCDEYAKMDNRVKVIHKENQGLGFARNSGMKIAIGEYIAFVDSDDWVKLDMFKNLYENAKKQNSDIAVSGHCDYTNGIKVRTKKHLLAGTTLKDKKNILEMRKNLYGHNVNDNIVDAFPMSVWIAIYKKECLKNNNVQFENILSEDIIFNLHAYRVANIISFIGDTNYCYRKDNQPSIMKTFSLNKEKQYLNFINRLMELAKSENDPECIMRVKRTAIDFTRLYIGIISDSNLDFKEKKKYAAKFAENEFIRKIWKGYPLESLPFQQKIYQKLLLNKNYGIILLLNYIRLKLKKIWH